MFPTKFPLSWVFGQKRKGKTDFQYGHHGGHNIATMVAILDLRSEQFKLFLIYKSPKYFLSSFKSIGLSIQEKHKINFQDDSHGSHLRFPFETILAIFDLQVTQMLPTKYFESMGPGGG